MPLPWTHCPVLSPSSHLLNFGPISSISPLPFCNFNKLISLCTSPDPSGLHLEISPWYIPFLLALGDLILYPLFCLLFELHQLFLLGIPILKIPPLNPSLLSEDVESIGRETHNAHSGPHSLQVLVFFLLFSLWMIDIYIFCYSDPRTWKITRKND